MTDQTGNDQLLEQMEHSLTGWADPVGRLRKALNGDELQLYVQPILALRPPVGIYMAETLIRLREEEALLLPPGDFLPVFEHYGMMPELDRWIVRQVLQWIQGSAQNSLKRLSINIASPTLANLRFPDFVARQLRDRNVNAQAVCFEIDENDTLTRMKETEVFAQGLRDAGCELLIDGFGRKSVSFSALTTLRVNYVKVDSSITRNVLSSAIAAKKMEAIVRVCDAIGVGVIAECIESKDVLEKHRSMGVGYAQGFGIKRPAPLPPAGTALR